MIPETRYVKTSDGVHIAYQVVGDGPFDLIYASGWVSNVEWIWDVPELGIFLRRLAELSRLIVFDRRGSGLSDRPPANESISLELSLDDIRSVMDAVGSQQVVLFCFENATVPGALFAASYPDRTSALVLFAAWARYRRAPDYPWAWTDEEAAVFLERLEREWGTESFWKWNAEKLSPTTPRDLDWIRAWARYSRLCASPGTIVAIERIIRDVDIRSVLPTIRVPTLVMHRTGNRAWPVGQSRFVAEQIPGAKFVELPGDAHPPYVGDTVPVLDELQRFVSTIREEEAEFDRMLATVLFTDIVGATERASEVGDRAWRELVERHHTTVRAMLARYHGREIDTAGDGFFATFDGPARAVRCARAIIDAVAPLGLEVRAGVHTGEVEMIDDKVGGIAVIVGARVGALAGPSEILASSTVKDLTAGSGLAFEDRGTRKLKGVPGRWRLYAVERG